MYVVGTMAAKELRDVAAATCRHIRCTFEFVTINAKTHVIPTEQSERRNPLK